MNKRILLVLTILLEIVNYGHAQLLFRVSGNGLGQPSYIFGTHHFAPLSIIDSIPSSKQVIDEVETVCGEIDMINTSQMAMAMQMQPYMMAPADSTLSQLISPEDYELAKGQFNAISGLQLEMFENMRPIVPQLVVVALGAKKSFGEIPNDEQIDSWFQKLGKEKGKQIAGLETLSQQAHILYNVTPLPIQARNLLKLLNDPEAGSEGIEKLTQAYMSRDLEMLVQVSQEQDEDAEDEAFIRALLHNRNAQWLDKIPEMMKVSPTLFVVGALHLPEKTGIIEGLRRAGYTVEAIMK